jgi:RNA polymerase sigma-70 factor (ECF subfamily)
MGEIGTRSVPALSAVPAADFADWVAPHLTSMHQLAGRLAPGAQDDVLQDALVRAWSRRATFDPDKGSARTWLLAVVAGEARRTRVRLRQRVHDIVPVEQPADVERDLDVQRAVESLPRRLRLAVELHYFLGLSVVETAQVMGVAEGTVKSTLHDARARLRPVLHMHTGPEES